MRRVYLATSWKNTSYPSVLAAIHAAGHEVYDFRDDNAAFNWRELQHPDRHDWQDWRFEEFRDVLAMPRAKDAFANDIDALEWADTGIVLLPCGRSAHMELGWLVGAGKPVALLRDPLEGQPFHHWRGATDAELMYGLVDYMASTTDDVVDWLAKL